MKQKTIIGTLARRIVLGMLCLWLVVMALTTVLLAGDLQQQGAAFYTPALERAVSAFLAENEGRETWDASEILMVPAEMPFTPTLRFPLLRVREMPSCPAGMTLNELGVIVANEGFDLGAIPLGESGLNVLEGSLGLNPSEALRTFSGRDIAYKTMFLTFQRSPGWGGMFPLSAGSYGTDLYTIHRAGIPQRSGEYDAGKVLNPAIFAPAGADPDAILTDPALLTAIESGELVFESHRLITSSVLRGCWLRDGEGNGRCFILAAVGWSPLLEALLALRAVYLLALVLFQAVGVLFWLGVRVTLTRPMAEMEAALRAEPLAVTEKEYDYRMPYGELRGPLAGHLLRRQMMNAEAAALLSRKSPPARPYPLLLPMLQRAEEKLMPILTDRGQVIIRQLRADGRVRTTPAQLEDTLLAFFREAVPFVDQNGPMVLRTEEKAGFLLVEAEIRVRRMKEDGLRLLWDGIYRGPRDMDAPGAKLRKAISALIGAFAAVRKTKHGLVLTLGLPLAGESAEAPESVPSNTVAAYQPRRTPAPAPMTGESVGDGADKKGRLKRVLVRILVILIAAAVIVLWFAMTLHWRRAAWH